MLPKIAKQMMEQVASTTSYIKEEEYKVDGQTEAKANLLILQQINLNQQSSFLRSLFQRTWREHLGFPKAN